MTMVKADYLIALAMIEKGQERFMPIGGKMVKEDMNIADLTNTYGNKIALELLLRVLQYTDQSAIKRASGNKSILLLKLDIKEMNQELPKAKSKWLNTGNTEELLENLKMMSEFIWKVTFVKYEGIKFIPL